MFLDDLGTQQGKPWETERLFQIVDRRLNSELATFVTTNLASGEVKSLMHERLASRLLGLCVPITLKARAGGTTSSPTAYGSCKDGKMAASPNICELGQKSRVLGLNLSRYLKVGQK